MKIWFGIGSGSIGFGSGLVNLQKEPVQPDVLSGSVPIGTSV